MSRRIHVQQALTLGPARLDSAQAHHLRDVLRLKAGDRVQAFDDAGAVAEAIIEQCDDGGVLLSVQEIEPPDGSPSITIASAIPKGERADWMIEKLSELGVSRFIPLAAERSVVLPKGTGKRERWLRLAIESAKQSRRAGVMQIDELTPVEKIVEGRRDEGRGQKQAAFYLSTEADATPIASADSALRPLPSALLLIGPEGGWSEREIELFRSASLTGVKLTGTILRVETAAIAAAAVFASIHASGIVKT